MSSLAAGFPAVATARGFSTAGLIVWLVIVLLMVGYGIGSYGLIEPDEGRNAEVAREMAVSNNYVLPHLNGLPYLDKPVLFFAAAAVFIEIFGPGEFAVRLVSVLFGLATAALVGWFAFRRWGRDAAAVAATATATAPLALGLSRVVIMDTMLSFFVVLALICFFVATERRASTRVGSVSRRQWLQWTLGGWAAIGFGVLIKGPVAFALPLLVATPFALRRRAAAALWHPLGPVVMLAVTLPWVWAVSREIPNFLQYVVVTETWARMTTDELRRTEPFWFFVPVLLAGAFPWSILMLSKLRSKLILDDPDDRWIRLYLWLWIVLPLVFFSLSRGKQEQYVLPLVPAVALLIASRWSDRQGGVRVAAAAWALLGLAALTYAVLGMPGLDTSRVSTAVASQTVIVFGVVALVGACLAGFGSVARRSLAVIGLALPMVVFPVVSSGLMKEVAASRSTRGLAAEIEDHLTPLTRLLWVESYAPGLSFYLQRTIPLASDDGDELRSNYILRNAQRFLDDAGPLRPLRSADWTLAECTGSQIFLLATQNQDLGDVIERSGVPRLTATRKWMAFGPGCVRESVPAKDSVAQEEVVN
jgi:4-amino-4-deoxy-L-arabinose transferase-like glycosyltransferase